MRGRRKGYEGRRGASYYLQRDRAGVLTFVMEVAPGGEGVMVVIGGDVHGDTTAWPFSLSFTFLNPLK